MWWWKTPLYFKTLESRILFLSLAYRSVLPNCFSCKMQPLVVFILDGGLPGVIAFFSVSQAAGHPWIYSFSCLFGGM